MKTVKIFFAILSLLAIQNSYSQKNKGYKIVGNLKDSLNKPIPNATIFVDGIKTKQKTSSIGFYSLNLKKKPKKLLFLLPDFNSIEITYAELNSNSNFNKKIKTDKLKIENFQFRDIYHYLRSRVAGVRVTHDNKIFIRGISSINSGTEPLFVVNGVATTNYISVNPNDIKNVKVLKGTDLATYGIRGANGVIEITTLIKE